MCTINQHMNRRVALDSSVNEFEIKQCENNINCVSQSIIYCYLERDRDRSLFLSLVVR